jgi:hypothetical protein
MAKNSLPGEGLNDQQQAALVQIGKMMGPHMTGFDQRVQDMHDEVHADEHARTDYNKVFANFPGEAGAGKMKAALTGGASVPIGPTQIQQQTAKGQQAAQQQAEEQGQLKAAQAQAAQTQGSEPAPEGPMPPAPKPPTPPQNLPPGAQSQSLPPGAQAQSLPPGAPGQQPDESQEEG